jgi:hypothetical protein
VQGEISFGNNSIAFLPATALFDPQQFHQVGQGWFFDCHASSPKGKFDMTQLARDNPSLANSATAFPVA